MVLSAPKEWSILWATADLEMRGRMETAIDRALVGTLEHLLQHAELVCRRGPDGARVHEPAAGLLVSAFRHHTSRVSAAAAAAGAGADPQLHDHCVVANMVRRADGRLVAADSRAFLLAQQEAGAIYRGLLADEARELGFETTRADSAWGVRGLSRDKVVWFSKRETEVLEAIARFSAEHGRPPTAEERRSLVVFSRGGKDADPTGDFPRWRREEAEVTARAHEAAVAEGHELGERPLLDPEDLSAAEIHAVARQRQEQAAQRGVRVSELVLPQDRPRTDEEIAAAVVRELTAPTPDFRGQQIGPDRLTSSSAVFDERELRTQLARELQHHHGGAARFAEILDEVHRSPELERIDAQHWTTRRHLETEQLVLDALRARHQTGGARVPSSVIEEAIAAARVPLDAEQGEAVWAFCSGRRLAVLGADAGTGKGEVARVVADAHRRAGYRVIAVSTSAETAQRFRVQSGADLACSIDALVLRAERAEQPGSMGAGRLGPRDLILVDEAGQIDTVGRWDQLMRVTGESIVGLIGDSGQLSAVTAGGLFPVVERTVGASRLTRVYRNPDQERVATWRQIREGKGREAVEAMYLRGEIRLVDDRRAAREVLVADWDRRHLDARAAGRPITEHALLTDTTNVQVDLLNRQIQTLRLERGEIAGLSTEVRYVAPEKGYVREELIYQGDVVKTTSSVWLGPGTGAAIPNGKVGEVVARRESGDLLVRFDDRAVWLDGEQRHALRLAYMRHQQSGQGITADSAAGLLGGRSTNREGAYVQASRSRGETLLVADLDTLGIPAEREVEPAREDRPAVVVPISTEERITMALDALGERFATSEAKEAALTALARVEQERDGAEAERRATAAGAVAPGSRALANTAALASARQLAYARSLGAEVPEGATWVEASLVIDRAKGADVGQHAARILSARGLDEAVMAETLERARARLVERVEGTRLPADAGTSLGRRDVARVVAAADPQVERAAPEVLAERPAEAVLEAQGAAGAGVALGAVEDARPASLEDVDAGRREERETAAAAERVAPPSPTAELLDDRVRDREASAPAAQAGDVERQVEDVPSSTPEGREEANPGRQGAVEPPVQEPWAEAEDELEEEARRERELGPADPAREREAEAACLDEAQGESHAERELRESQDRALRQEMEAEAARQAERSMGMEM